MCVWCVVLADIDHFLFMHHMKQLAAGKVQLGWAELTHKDTIDVLKYGARSLQSKKGKLLRTNWRDSVV